jgi:hypothetical protein
MVSVIDIGRDLLVAALIIGAALGAVLCLYDINRGR